ncbi:MAG: tyrosine-type recombinase/integrase [Alphaproteobacteria bacterium]|nr:tyrosine-type recombinase/integrase [Alphaproteobacteria bacterium]
MSRQRKPENKGLPARWRFVHNAYYYQVPPELMPLWEGRYTFRLGKTLQEAYKSWSDRLTSTDKANNIAQLLDRYALDVVPLKAPKTQRHNFAEIKRLRAVFGNLPLVAIKPQHIYQYVDKRTGKVAAHREIAVLSHAFTKAVQWGYIDKHPFKGEVRLGGEKPRTRYVEDWEVVECLSLASVRNSGSVLAIQAYIRIKLLTGLRRGDLLRLSLAQITDDGIAVSTHKTGKPIIYEWSPELRLAIDEAIEARPSKKSPWLFCTKRGEGYLNEKTGEASGWNSMWQRFMVRVLAETKVTERFTEHDLRAKCASDAGTLEHAKSLLTHADSSLTQRVYRRKPERVQPAKLTFE